MTWLALVGCSPAPPVAESWMSEEHVWSAPAPAARDQHHATVVVLPDPDEIAAVGWTDGEAWDAPQAEVRWIAPDGSPGRQHTLADGGTAGKPDVDHDGLALLAGHQAPGGIDVERVEGEAVISRRIATVPELDDNNSVDVAVAPDGRIVVVWYEAHSDVGTYRATTIGPDLAPAPGLDTTVSTTDHKSPVSPDVDVAPSGDAGIAWVDQPFDTDVTLWLDRWSEDGTQVWRTLLATQDEAGSPRRPTVVARADGSFVVAWRARSEGSPLPSASWVAVVGADGSLAGVPVGPPGDDTDEIVIAAAGDDVWAVWTEVTDPVSGGGVIWGGLLSVPDGAWVAEPVRLSDTEGASRPHTDTEVTEDGFRWAASWEQATPRGRVIRGRVGDLALP